MDKLTGTSYRECKTQNRFRTTAFARVYSAAKYCNRARTTHCTKVSPSKTKQYAFYYIENNKYKNG